MRLTCLAPVFAFLALASSAQADLTANNLLLVCNGNSRASVRAAEFYAQTRAVPAGRIVKLDLPDLEEIPFETYERNVVPPLRQFLREQKLTSTVTCLVLFYGTPIRIAAPKIDDATRAETANLKSQLAAAESQARTVVSDFETFVAAEAPGFNPPASNPAEPVEATFQRLEHAVQAIAPILSGYDSERRTALQKRTLDTLHVLIGEDGVRRFNERIAPAAFATTQAATDAATRRSADEQALKTAVSADTARFTEAVEHRFDPAARAQARELVRQIAGLHELIPFLRDQINYFGTDQAQAALDSELPLLWHNGYDRNRWLPNYLNYHIANYSGPPVLMTSRVDGPDEGSAGLLLLASMKAEREGLTGRAVIDARGIKPAPGNGYGVYDESLRRLAAILQKTRLPLTFDDKDALLPANSVKDVALYVGWYSVGNYVPCCKFVPGAVGFHIASFEMVTLHDPKTRAWVPNLIRDGVAATLGPVAEPYLHAFPEADEFFPLLLTGKLTLAECYWKTQKTLSWQISLIGDPLYRPFAKNPQLKEEDLAPELRKALH